MARKATTKPTLANVAGRLYAIELERLNDYKLLERVRTLEALAAEIEAVSVEDARVFGELWMRVDGLEENATQHYLAAAGKIEQARREHWALRDRVFALEQLEQADQKWRAQVAALGFFGRLGSFLRFLLNGR